MHITDTSVYRGPSNGGSWTGAHVHAPLCKLLFPAVNIASWLKTNLLWLNVHVHCMKPTPHLQNLYSHNIPFMILKAPFLELPPLATFVSGVPVRLQHLEKM